MGFRVAGDTPVRSAAPLRLADPEPVDEPDVSFFHDLLPAGIARASTLAPGGEGMPTFGVQNPDFDPFENIAGYEEWSGAFADADTPEEVQAVKRQADRERKRDALLASGGFYGHLAEFVGGLLDPILLIPIGGAAQLARKGSVLKAGLATMAAGAGSMGASELVLQNRQVTRTFGESALNIGGAAFLSGVLGTAVSALGSRARTRAIAQIEADLGESGIAGAAGGLPFGIGRGQMPVADVAMEGGGELGIRLKGALGVEKMTAHLRLSPLTTELVTSPSQVAREVVVQLVDVPYPLKRNGVDMVVPGSAEDAVRATRADLAEFLEAERRLFVQYRTGQAGGRVKQAQLAVQDALGRTPARTLNRRQFREAASVAAHAGDEHAIPEVAEVARAWRKMADKYKDKAIELGVLPEGIEPRGALSYLMRQYNSRAIVRDREEFVALVRDNFLLQDELGRGADAGTPALTRADAEAAAEQVVEKILGLEGDRLLYEGVPVGGTAATKRRAITIPHPILEPFLERDITKIARAYMRTMGPDLVLKERFGDVTMSKQLKDIRDDYTRLQAEAKSPAAKEKLGKRMEQTLENVRAMRDRVRGTYGQTANPDAPLVRMGRVARNVNVLNIGGGFQLSSIPDIGKIAMVHGIRRSFKHALIPLVTDLKGLKLAGKQLRMAGEGLDLDLDSRTELLFDLGEELPRHTAFERGLGSLARGFGMVSLLSPWNAGAKTLAGAVIQTRIGELAEAITKGGRVLKKDRAALAHLGLDDDMMRRIAAQPWENRGLLRLSDTEAWTDVEALRAYRSALRRSVAETIVTPGAGDLPKLTSTEQGKLIFQFKSFGFATVNRTLIPGLQQRDMAFLNGLMVSVGLGMMVFAIKQKIAGRDLPDSSDGGLGRWIAEGIDRSGVLGFYADMMNIADTASRGTIGPRALLGGPRLSRYAVQGRVGALLGPTVSQAERVFQVSGALQSGDVKQGDVRAMRRMVPYQNLYYVSHLFDKLEEAAGGMKR